MMGRNKKYIRKPRISNRMMSSNSQPRKYGTASIPIPHTDLMNTANIRARIIGLLWRINFDMKELYSAYRSEFDKVFMVHLHRNFVDWLESLFYQRFIHPNFKTRYFFVFHSAYKQYMRYE